MKRMKTRGEIVSSCLEDDAEGASVYANLSGKKTLVGRNSGKCSWECETPKGLPSYEGKLSGNQDRDYHFILWLSLSFFVLFTYTNLSY